MTHVIAGSAEADTNLDNIWKPLIGAATPTPQSLDQFNERFDGVPSAGFADSKFPTKQ